MDAEKKRLRDEVAELSEAVRDLRDELAQERLMRAAQGCGHGCHCVHPVWVYPNVYYPQPYVLPTVTYSGSGTYSATIPGTVTTNTTYSLPCPGN